MLIGGCRQWRRPFVDSSELEFGRFGGSFLTCFGVFARGQMACSAGILLAKDDDDEDRKGLQRPPQLSQQGFESTDQLLKDIERAERGPKYSAWIVESSRFLNVPHRAFQPDVGDPAFVDLPVNVGIIKAANGDVTLYDSGGNSSPTSSTGTPRVAGTGSVIR